MLPFEVSLEYRFNFFIPLGSTVQSICPLHRTNFNTFVTAMFAQTIAHASHCVIVALTTKLALRPAEDISRWARKTTQFKLQLRNNSHPVKDLNLLSLMEHTIRSLNHIGFDKPGELKIWTTSKKVSIRLYYILIWVGVAYMKPTWQEFALQWFYFYRSRI